MEELLSAAQAARVIGITPGGISHAMKFGRLSYEQHGPFRLITRRDAENYKKNRPFPGRPRKNSPK